MLDRRIDKFFHFSKVNDLIELLANFALRHSENCAVEVNVLPPGELRVEARSDLEQARDTPTQQDAPFCRLGDAAQDLQQRALSGAVATDDTENLALFDLEAHIPKRPKFLDFIALHHLPTTNDIGRLARKIVDFASDDVAQRRVFVFPPEVRTGGQSDNVLTDFRQRSLFRHGHQLVL